MENEETKTKETAAPPATTNDELNMLVKSYNELQQLQLATDRNLAQTHAKITATVAKLSRELGFTYNFEIKLFDGGVVDDTGSKSQTPVKE